MLTIEDVNELIGMALRDMPPDLKRLYDEEVLRMEKEMLTTGKTIYIIKHEINTLPILKYLSNRELIALAISGGVILWVYRGMSMLIPAARIKNLANLVEDVNKWASSKTYKMPKFGFTIDDAIMLPKKIADALLGDN